MDADERGKDAPPSDKELAEERERLDKLRRTREVLNELPPSPARERMLQMNAASTIQSTSRLGVLSKARLAVSDFFDDQLQISETFREANETGLPEETMNMGKGDRARHILWMQNLAEKHGKGPARAIGLVKEAQNLFDPFKFAIGGVLDGQKSNVILERVIESLRESGRDVKTNEFALNFMPHDEQGNPVPLSPDEVAELMYWLDTSKTPVEGKEIAEAPNPLNMFRNMNPRGEIRFGQPEQVAPPIKDEEIEDLRRKHLDRMKLGVHEYVEGQGAVPVDERRTRRMKRDDI